MNYGNIYQNTNFNVNNGQETFFCNKDEKTENIDTIINNMFTNNYINRIKVYIKTKNSNFKTTLIGKTNSKLITLDNKLINIKDILDIKEIN